mmetsp:Transcript_501/g.796  ORF Transcript_501/g.796 Transcript_501/m.796 type:complete len:138 (-) Transcript_501:472-885(-)
MKRVAITSPSNVRTAPSIALNILGAFARSSISVLLWVSARFLGVLHNGSTFGECGSAGFGAVFFSSTLATLLVRREWTVDLEVGPMTSSACPLHTPHARPTQGSAAKGAANEGVPSCGRKARGEKQGNRRQVCNKNA